MRESDVKKIPPEHLQVLAHYYRGEIYRSSVWRTRLDVTTNWAILAATAAFSYAYTSAEGVQSHILFPLVSLLVLLLLGIEARRYRYYDLWWTRARMLETHLIVPSLNPELNILQGDWREFLSNDLFIPSFKISFWESFARRLAQNYVWIFLLLFGGWVLRVYTASDTNDDKWVTLKEFYSGCGFSFVHPIFSLGFQVSFTATMLVILFVNWRGRRITGEIRRKDPDAPKWPI